MARYKEMQGEQHGRLRVLRYVGNDKWRVALWECECECGTTVTKRRTDLVEGLVKSCGCLNDETRRRKRVTVEHIARRKKANWQDWYAQNKERCRERNKQWIHENGDRLRETRRTRERARLESDLGYKLTVNLRKRLCIALRRNYKSGSAISDLGCSIDELRSHLEDQFYPRETGEPMTWENYGRWGWHIDHIRPLMLLAEGETVPQLCHYSNLQPLWFEDNLAKRKLDHQATGLCA